MEHRTFNLESIASDFYRDWWRLCPSAGSRAGLYEYDAELECPGPDWIRSYRTLLVASTAKLKALREPPESSSAFLDRKVFQSHLSVALLHLDEIAHWRQDVSRPLTDAVESIFELTMRRDIRQEDTARAILLRLQKLPEYLRAACERVDEPVSLWQIIARDTVAGGIEFLREAGRELKQLHPRMSQALETETANACTALSEYGEWVGSLQGRTMKEDVSAGPAAMSQLVKEWHGLDYSLDEIVALGHSLVEFFKDELNQHARRLDAEASWPEIMNRAREQFARHYAGASDGAGRLLKDYHRITEDLRERISLENLLDLPPGETCKVISSPGFLRAMLPTAAYTNPGPLDPRQIGVFFVSDPDPAMGAQSYLANLAQHYGIEETCIHEAYPGHHVQLCWANRAGSLIRQMADHIIFMEGWTLYCEQWMIDAGWFPDPALRINYLVGQLWRAYRMIIDVGLHTRQMTVPQAAAMLVEGVGFTPERAQAELNWYSQSPGVPLSYMMGKRETLNLRDEFFRRRGRNLREFHSWLLRFGSVPQRWLWPHLPPPGSG